MYHVIVKDGEGNIIYSNSDVESMKEGITILEDVFEDVDNSDDYVVDFNLNE